VQAGRHEEASHVLA
jgi:ATP/maltotriose-dependent transcriptional regulator MalT